MVSVFKSPTIVIYRQYQRYIRLSSILMIFYGKLYNGLYEWIVMVIRIISHLTMGVEVFILLHYISPIPKTLCVPPTPQ